VSACALAPGACGGEVEEGLGLTQMGPSLQAVDVGAGGLRARAWRKTRKRKPSWVRSPLQRSASRRFTCLLDVVGRPDFGERRDPSVLGAEHGGLRLHVVEMVVGCAVQRTEPLSCGRLGLRPLQARSGRKAFRRSDLLLGPGTTVLRVYDICISS